MPFSGVPRIHKRSLWVPASAYEPAQGAPTAGVTGDGWCQAPYWALDDSTNEGVGTSVLLPANIAANLSVQIYFCMDTAIANDVRVISTLTPVAVGALLSTARTTSGDVLTVPGVAQTLAVTKDLVYTHVPRRGLFTRHAVWRYAAHANDTAAGDLWFLGARITWDEDILTDH